MACFSGPEIVNDGLVLHLDAANSRSYPGSGTVWNDLSENENDGNLVNGPSYNSNNNGSIYFDGTNNFSLSLYNNNDLDGDPNFAVEMWIKRTGTINSNGYWGLGGDTISKGINGYTWPGQTNKIGIDLWGNTTFHCGQDYPLDKWVHITWVKFAPTFSTNTIYIYVNNIRYDSTDFLVQRGNSGVTPSLNVSDSTRGFVIGRVGSTTNNYYAQGEIGSAKVYNRALSATEIKQNFEATRSRYGI